MTVADVLATVVQGTLGLMFSPWGAVATVPLIVAWVAAVAAGSGKDEPPLDEWDNGRAHRPGDLCAVLGCDRLPTVAYGHHRDTVTVCGLHAPCVV